MISHTLAARIVSHYAASSSTAALAASIENSFGCMLPLYRCPLWRSLHHSAGLLLDANSVVQANRQGGPAPAPASGSADSELSRGNVVGPITPGPQGETDAGPSVLGVPRPHRKQLLVPSSVLQELRPPAQPYQLTPVLAQRPTGAPAQYVPWTPTRALQRRKHVSKRMAFLIHVLEREQVERVRRARPLPDFRAGDVLEVRMMLPEAERKVAIYRGVCIARYNKGIRSTFKFYNVYPECGGVVQHIPLYMPDLLGIKVVGRIPATQERLFYLLERETSDYTFQTGVSAAH